MSFLKKVLEGFTNIFSTKPYVVTAEDAVVKAAAVEVTSVEAVVEAVVEEAEVKVAPKVRKATKKVEAVVAEEVKEVKAKTTKKKPNIKIAK